MTTATPTPTRTAAAELPQTGDNRWNGPLDREDPQVDERVRLPRQQSAVAEAASQYERGEFSRHDCKDDSDDSNVARLVVWATQERAGPHQARYRPSVP